MKSSGSDKRDNQLLLRLDEDVKELLALAHDATGSTKKEIINDCIRRQLPQVVEEILEARDRAKAAFKSATAPAKARKTSAGKKRQPASSRN